MKILKAFFFTVSVGIFSSCLISCYRMPTENDWSVVPTTNNPAITHERNDNFIPGMGY